MKVIDRLIHGAVHGKKQEELEKEREIELSSAIIRRLYSTKSLEYQHPNGQRYKLDREGDELAIYRWDRYLPPVPCASTKEKVMWMVCDWRERLMVLRALWEEF